MKLKYIIDNNKYFFESPDNQEFAFGVDTCLSNEYSDLLFNQDWYKDGFSVFNVFDLEEFNRIYLGISRTVKKIISDLNIDVTNFKLENYHHFVNSDDNHYKVVSRTRDLFAADFTDFDVLGLIRYLEAEVGFGLTDIFPRTGQHWHIIVRINRPNSNDYNPPHQDLDDLNFEPMINVWIPICGVDKDSSLCVVKGSHLIPLNKIEKSVNGGILGKNNYSVRMIKSWNGSNELTRVDVNEGDVLFFTPFLIHGMAYNQNQNITRVALEFRLFKKG